jgi:cation diffusion facilitator CzcD-associated flavoprotein CzcO
MSITSSDTDVSFFDVIIVGAGISGINAAYRLQEKLPNYSYTVLEARDTIGGTWDLFRYPGIRSDSDLITFGFAWHPWEKQNPIADGASILSYMKESAAISGVDKHILFKHYLSSASWSSKDGLWTLCVIKNEQKIYFSARFLVFGTGYYDYNEPMKAEIPGIDNFGGQVIHPQFWPEDLDYTDKNVVVIGSGATAVTLIPQLAQKAAKATMLQRSPTYIVSLPNRTSARPWLSYILPDKWYHKLRRLAWVFTSRLFVLWCRRYPNAATKLITKGVTKQLPVTIPYDPHFKPIYRPWEQRLCICPDGDFFKALRSGKGAVETGTIKQVVKDGIELNSGSKLDADIIVTATGLKMRLAGGVSLEVDGRPFDISQKFMWNGVMLQDLPNASFIIGYTDASWTLGADATAQFICRFLKHLDRKNCIAAIPYAEDSSKLTPGQILNLTSTYVTAAQKVLPKSASQAPWTARKGFLQDSLWANYGNIDRGLKFIHSSVPTGGKKLD